MRGHSIYNDMLLDILAILLAKITTIIVSLISITTIISITSITTTSFISTTTTLSTTTIVTQQRLLNGQSKYTIKPVVINHNYSIQPIVLIQSPPFKMSQNSHSTHLYIIAQIIQSTHIIKRHYQPEYRLKRESIHCQTYS